MKTYEIINENVSYYVDSISVPVNATEEDINDGLSNAEMDISIDWGDAWEPAPYEVLHFDYQSPYTEQTGETSLTGYLDLREFCKAFNVSLKYTDAWGIKQDKIPLIIKVCVFERED